MQAKCSVPSSRNHTPRAARQMTCAILRLPGSVVKPDGMQIVQLLPWSHTRLRQPLGCMVKAVTSQAASWLTS